MSYGNVTGMFTEFKSYEEFYSAFLKHLDWALGLICEEHNIQLNYWKTYVPDALTSIFMHEGVSSGKEMMNRRMVYENAALANMVGVVNAINSLAAVKKLVFDEKKVSAEKLVEALNANWEGYEDIRKLCLEAPKFGNNDPYVDSIAARLWTDFAGFCKHHYTIFGESMVPAGISITAYAPGGNSMGPTPDGRVSGETLADGSISPMQGSDTNGPIAVLQSGMAINQDEFMSTLLNMKFSPSTLKTDSDLGKLGALIKTYLTNGGKHIQFNVIDKNTLLDAQVNREAHRDLIVRVAGYSAYFVALTKSVQEDVISRTSHDI
jgi:formate C-acetyltransferase